MEAAMWVWRILGLLVAAATAISMIKRGFAIDLRGVPAALYEQYVWLRDTLFVPVDWVLGYAAFSLTEWQKDVMVAYAVVAGAHWRSFNQNELNVFAIFASRKNRPYDISGAELRPVVTKTSVFWSVGLALLWPMVQVAIWVRLLAKRAEIRRSMLGRKRTQTVVLLRQVRGTIFRNLAALVLVAVAFFAWNHLQAYFGHGGGNTPLQ